MPYVKVWIHSVWSTYKGTPLLTKEIRPLMLEHIRENAKNKNIYIDCINGYTNHLHCLFSLRSDQTITKVMQLIKGESAFWINKQQLLRQKFAWQEEYYAVSIGESDLKRVRNYIKNQETHHSKRTFEQEWVEFLEKYKFEKSTNPSL
ncbi:MAG: IS200/IS605 family transposase [Bacteroidales bacterium]|nr:IS200/IS605 family transposase [Bacteroidales bacterium]